MTLFVKTPKRLLEINDFYVMVLSFLIFFAVGQIVKKTIAKLEQKNAKNINMPNNRGGSLNFELSDDTELAFTILSCIAENEPYLVKDPRIIELVFGLAKAKIKEESLVLTPNLMRFLALKLIKPDQTLIVKIGNILVSSNNRARLLARVYGAAILGFVGALFSALPYAILMFFLYFDVSENCGYKCPDYFEHIPKEAPVRIYGEKSTGHLAIAGNDDARQIEIYTPSKASDEIITSKTGKIKTIKSYTKTRKKAKEVKFSDFKQNDPVLSAFKDLEEPAVPQKLCPINDIHDVINIRVD